MRRRLLGILLALGTCLVAALGAPLAYVLTSDLSQELFVSRADDAAYFADVAETALQTGHPARLRALTARYQWLYDSPVTVIDPNGRTVISSGEAIDVRSPANRPTVLHALAGRPPERPSHLAWPWNPRNYLIAEPIIRDGRVLGAVLIESPTQWAREQAAWMLGMVVFGCAVVLAVLAHGVAVPIVGWVLRPVRHLDNATHQVAAGHLEARVPEQTGPPELRRLTTHFNAMADSVADAIVQQREFVAQASHQLRNPLTSLRLRIESLEHVEDVAGRQDLAHAVEEIERLERTVDGLLELARAEASQLERRPVDVGATVRHRVASWYPAFERCDTPLILDAPEAEIAANCLPDVLDDAVDALLHNALKFAPGRLVSVTVRRDRSDVVVEVRDRGEQLPAEEAARVGERFWRSRRHQNVPGTGLGLAVTRTLVEGVGGTLTVEPTQPHGLVARIRLPTPPGQE
ncbi:HAMP domain-containing sensor histidine kinase [Saccharopolyspora halophila]|uniref:histidine kinase n=1 Tax=Saccharopolyspora halophila TaxID=405551 RepID=A0ABN3GX17_9PSEU